MRLPWISWDKTLQRLGLVRRTVRRAREEFRRPQVEQLETRDLLTTVSVAAIQDASEPSGTGKLRITCSPPVDEMGTGLNVYFGFSGTADWGMGGSGDYTSGDVTPTGIWRTIQPGDNQVDIDFTVVDDGDPESLETVVVTLVEDAGSYEIGNGTATAHISDNDSTVITIAATDSAASEAGQNTGTFTISVSPAPTSDLTVNISRSGSATYSADYSDSPNSVIIPAGQTSRTVTITPVDDNIYESGGETVVYTITGGTGYGIGANSSATVTITENDTAPTVSIADWTDVESQNAAFTVSLTRASSQSVTVNYSSQNGTAVGGSDFTGVSGGLTFSPGETSKTVNVNIVHDSTDEVNETFNVNLSGASGATIGDGSGLGTILDDDGPTVSIGDVSVTEGGNVVFTVSLSAASPQTITLDYSSQPWEAVSPADYTAVSGTLTFSAGQTSKTITVVTQQDALDEDNERFKVELSNLVNAFFNDSLGIGTIGDDDPLPALSINSVTVTEAAQTATFTVSLSAVSGRTVTVNYATSDQSAVSPDDYTATNGTATIAAGSTTATITVPIIDDASDENDETFLVTLSSPTNATVATGIGTGTITDNDGPPSLSVDDAMVSESGGNLVFTVHVSAASGKQITVQYSTTNVTAVAPDDYASTSGTLTIPAGDTTATILVPVVSDTIDEVDETLQLDLSNATNANIEDGSAAGTIDDNDGPAISINDVSISEASTPASFTISVSTVSPQEVRVNWTTANGTALAGSDYTASSGTAVIAAGQTSTTVSVPIINDSRDEDDQTFSVILSAPIDATIADGTGVGTILDDDDAPTLSIQDSSLEEADGAMTFGVTLSGPSEKTITVQYNTSDVTATANSDYCSTSGTFTFASLETSKTLYVTIKHDTQDEIDETFLAFLITPVNATLGDGTAVGTIEDNDGPNISIGSILVPESVGNALLTVTLSASSPQAVVVHYQTSNGSAVSPADYTTTSGDLQFDPGVTSRTISVPITSDTLDEVDETFDVTLSSPIDGFVDSQNNTGTVTIDDDDGPLITIDDPTASEGAGSLVFHVHLSATSPQTVTVNYHTQNQSALSTSDYVSKSGTLTFSPGTVENSVAVSVSNDILDEVDETLQLILDGPEDGYFGDSEGIGTIDDNDGPTVSISDAWASESAGAMEFVVSLSATSPQDVVVTYSTANQTAFAGADYTGASSATVTIPHGQLSATLSVPILEDTLDESNEQFQVILASAVDGAISTADNIGTGRIIDNDSAPSVSVNDVQVAENSGPAHFAISLSAPSGKVITVPYIRQPMAPGFPGPILRRQRARSHFHRAKRLNTSMSRYLTTIRPSRI